MRMNKQELLTELDTYFVTRKTEQKLTDRTIGDTNVYNTRGTITRLADRAEEHDIVFYVEKEGTGVTEKAYYSGDPLNFFWRLKVLDYITITNQWSGRVFQATEPKAICRVLEDPAVGEKWVLITETSKDVFSVTDIVGDILTDI